MTARLGFAALAAASLAACQAGCSRAPSDADVRAALSSQAKAAGGEPALDALRDELPSVKVVQCVESKLGGYDCDYAGRAGASRARFVKGSGGWAMMDASQAGGPAIQASEAPEPTSDDLRSAMARHLRLTAPSPAAAEAMSKKLGAMSLSGCKKAAAGGWDCDYADVAGKPHTHRFVRDGQGWAVAEEAGR